MSSSLARAFDVLDLFTLETPRLTSEEVSARLGYSRSMAYRYLKELCDAGLLVPQSGGQYERWGRASSSWSAWWR